MAVVLPAGNASAGTLTVCKLPAVCTYDNVQDAVLDAVDGDVVDVAAGTYDENVLVDGADITIRGARAGVDARGRTADAGDTVINGGTSIALQADGVSLTVDGLVLRSGTTSSNAGIDLTTANLTVRNSIFDKGARGVNAVGAGLDSVLVERSRFALTSYAVFADTLAALEVRTSQITTTSGTGAGIRANTVAATNVHDSTITSPTSLAAEGVYLLGPATTVAVTNNVVANYSPGVRVGTSTTGAIDVRFNRFDRALAASTAVRNERAAAIVANDNWFDCAAAPTASGCFAIAGSGPTTVATWIDATVTTPSATVYVPADVPFTVAARRSDGTAIPAGMTTMEGAPVDFTFGGSSAGVAPATATIVGGSASAVRSGAPAGATTATATITGTKFSTPVNVRIPAPKLTAPVSFLPARFGAISFCRPGTWSGTGTYTYAWLRDGVAIAGAAMATYAPTSNDIGHLLACRVTISATNQDDATATSAAAKVTRRIVKLAILQSTAKGVSLTCGTLAKPCVVKRGTVAFAKLVADASHPAAIRAGVAIDVKVGRTWKPKSVVTGALGAKAVALATKTLPAGQYRFRVVYKGSALDLPTTSAYRYFKVR